MGCGAIGPLTGQETRKLFDLPFRQVFTAEEKYKTPEEQAVRPAISAGVHSEHDLTFDLETAVRPAISAGRTADDH